MMKVCNVSVVVGDGVVVVGDRVVVVGESCSSW